MIQTKYIQIRIFDDNKYGQFNDAVYFIPEDFDLLTEEDVTSQCQQRVDDWKDLMSIPVIAHADTLPELIDEKSQLEARLLIVNQLILEQS